MDDKRMGELRASAIKQLELGDRALKARLQARIDRIDAASELTRLRLQNSENHADLVSNLALDAIMSW